MRLVTFIHNGENRIGALEERNGKQVVIDLNRADQHLPVEMIPFLEGGEAALALAQDAVAEAGETEEIQLSAVTLKAPIPRPGKIICIGLNYRDHAEESNMPIPDAPTVFSKYANSVIGHREPIVIPKVTDKIDYEGELAVVIGRRGRYIPERGALDFVAGYTCFNDVSARDFQMRTSQWTIGKTFDTFAPMGPALVSADQVPDPHNLDLCVTVSGAVLQNSNTCNLIFSVPELIAYISQVMTLEPGDVIVTGTPGGVGFARNPPRYLRPGDIVQVEIEGLGRLVNPVAQEVG